ncbi:MULTISPECIES: restriction endonuclease [unclassified Clostridium]|uniref:restriction endonuclease n=1 Tax=Clostridium TaxID=1485 RepID=UPI001C8B1125|nr:MULTISPECIES: restriction endonuclease [unclassified Clostridium]MBX9138007.1 restriction endonuclease [Clostridium sp. K12(2020)]MBX9144730.1 restriction endonuclease [Clostridium sp. K13]MDU2292000.1 restriction endonuclease [Clostridium celatum]
MKLNTIYSYFIIILFAPLMGKLIKKIITYYKSYKNFKSDTQLYSLIHRLTPHEFEIWCSEYLSTLGFSNIILLPLGPDGGKNIICEKDSQKFYIECKRYSLNDSISPFHIEKLLGAMISDNINNGIIITTGSISDDVKSILSKVNEPYNIKIISSTELDIPYTEYILKTN